MPHMSCQSTSGEQWLRELRTPGIKQGGVGRSKRSGVQELTWAGKHSEGFTTAHEDTSAQGTHHVEGRPKRVQSPGTWRGASQDRD